METVRYIKLAQHLVIVTGDRAGAVSQHGEDAPLLLAGPPHGRVRLQFPLREAGRTHSPYRRATEWPQSVQENPGCLSQILIFIHPGPGLTDPVIPYPVSRIQQQQEKRREKS